MLEPIVVFMILIVTLQGKPFSQKSIIHRHEQNILQFWEREMEMEIMKFPFTLFTRV